VVISAEGEGEVLEAKPTEANEPKNEYEMSYSSEVAMKPVGT
jgi:hypothetical protein